MKNNKDPYYAVLRVEKDFGDNYGMPDIAKFVQKVTRDTPIVDDDERPLKTSSVDVDRSCGIGTKVLDFLYPVMLYGMSCSFSLTVIYWTKFICCFLGAVFTVSIIKHVLYLI